MGQARPLTNGMHVGRRTALVAGAIVLAAAVGGIRFAAAQVDCDTMVGPARSDCHIGLSRINRQKSEIAATSARQQADTARLYRVTRKHPKTPTTPKATGH
jgi:hypothetical protein